MSSYGLYAVERRHFNQESGEMEVSLVEDHLTYGAAAILQTKCSEPYSIFRVVRVGARSERRKGNTTSTVR